MKTLRTILTRIVIAFGICIITPNLTFAQNQNNWRECHRPIDVLDAIIPNGTSQSALHAILDESDMVYELNNESLMIVYSDLLEEEDDMIGFLMYGIHDFSGNRFTITSEIAEIETFTCLHADYTGQLGGNSLLMSQYVMPGITGEMLVFRVLSSNQMSHIQANNTASQILRWYAAPDHQELARCGDR